MNMKKVLFYTFIFIFLATAIITLLGLIVDDLIAPGYLDKLFYLLIAETIAPVIALFKKTNFFEEDQNKNEDQDQDTSKVSIVMLPKESFPRSSDPHTCTITIFNQDTDEEQTIDGSPKRANGYLSMFLISPTEQELVKVKLVSSSNEIWESDYFSPSVVKAEMEKV